MLKSECNEGQWVRFLTTDTRHQFEGFVVTRRDSYARVAIPKIQKTRSIPYSNLIDFEGVTQNEQDIDAMIDVALDQRDYGWVNELSEMKEVLTQWK